MTASEHATTAREASTVDRRPPTRPRQHPVTVHALHLHQLLVCSPGRCLPTQARWRWRNWRSRWLHCPRRGRRNHNAPLALARSGSEYRHNSESCRCWSGGARYARTRDKPSPMTNPDRKSLGQAPAGPPPPDPDSNPLERPLRGNAQRNGRGPEKRCTTRGASGGARHLGAARQRASKAALMPNFATTV